MRHLISAFAHVVGLMVAIIDTCTATKINKNELAIIAFGKVITHKASGNTALPPLPNYTASHYT